MWGGVVDFMLVAQIKNFALRRALRTSESELVRGATHAAGAVSKAVESAIGGCNDGLDGTHIPLAAYLFSNFSEIRACWRARESAFTRV